MPATAKATRTYTVAQLKQAAYNAGFRGNALTIAVAVSLAENQRRDPTAVSPPNRVDGSHDHGAWQINDRAHPDLMKKYNVHTLQGNANAAYAVYRERGNKFTPWTVYKTKAYTKYLSAAQFPGTDLLKGVNMPSNPGAPLNDSPLGAAINGALGVGGIVTGNDAIVDFASQGIPTPLKSLGDIAQHLLDPAFWKRVGMGALALLLIIIALLLMLGSSKRVRSVATKGIV